MHVSRSANSNLHLQVVNFCIRVTSNRCCFQHKRNLLESYEEAVRMGDHAEQPMKITDKAGQVSGLQAISLSEKTIIGEGKGEKERRGEEDE